MTKPVERPHRRRGPKGKAKPDQVRMMRHLANAGTLQKHLCAMFDLSAAQVSRIVRGLVWEEVK
jgi:hypothetical protein